MCLKRIARLTARKRLNLGFVHLSSSSSSSSSPLKDFSQTAYVKTGQSYHRRFCTNLFQSCVRSAFYQNVPTVAIRLGGSLSVQTLDAIALVLYHVTLCVTYFPKSCVRAVLVMLV